MNRVELLTVTEGFQLSGIGLMLTPDFAVPPGWKNISEEIWALLPDGTEFKAQAQFNKWHFNFGRTPTAEQQQRAWRIFVSLPEANKMDVPAGSRLLVSPELRLAILGDGASESHSR
ncbi:MAG: hypothetical protein LBE81_10440 [Azonexus sp.]|uniref:hypothetical protein n=1 Tax=Azonexus sp. TaxID=1872668 RepID=UPI002820909F|nr:hypothetical protein [Azonexus sp.]MDR0777037.1 hypothetical protein [Azonexus sp.]